jgi:hypothetical protein
MGTQENQVAARYRIVFVLSVACAFLTGALLAPRAVEPARAQGGSVVESRCVKNEDDANELGREGWEVVTSAGAGNNLFRYCFVRRQ